MHISLAWRHKRWSDNILFFKSNYSYILKWMCKFYTGITCKHISMNYVRQFGSINSLLLSIECLQITFSRLYPYHYDMISLWTLISDLLHSICGQSLATYGVCFKKSKISCFYWLQIIGVSCVKQSMTIVIVW